MKYRPFGASGIEVSEIILGAGNVGGLYTGDDVDTQRQVLRDALEAGVNWVDTAFRYGDGRSETALGRLLPEIEDDPGLSTPHLSTKVNIAPEDLSDIEGAVERGLAESLTRLGRDSVDLFQLHNRIGERADGRLITTEQVLGPGGVADGLERLKDQGLTRLIGITGLGETPAIRQAIESGRFDSAQIYCNMLNPSAARPMPPAWTGQDFERLMQTAQANGTAVIVIRSFAAGVLATTERHGRESILTSGVDLESELTKADAVFGALSDEHGTMAETALRFVLSQPGVSCVDVGVASADQLAQALKAVENGPLPADALARLDALYETNFGLG